MKKSDIPTGEGKVIPLVEESASVDDLKNELDRLRGELSMLPARKRSALEADDADAFAEASLRELQLPGLVKFAEARLLRAEHTETSLLLVQTEGSLVELKSSMDSLVRSRDEVFERTQAERVEAQKMVDQAGVRLQQAHNEIFIRRGELADFERRIETLLAGEG